MISFRDALARLVDALDAWDADCFTPKADPERARATFGELAEAREAARVALEIEP